MDKIDLTVPQIVAGDVLVEVSNNEDFSHSYNRYLLSYDGALYHVWKAGLTAGRCRFYPGSVTEYKYARHIKEKTMRQMTRDEMMAFVLRNKVMVRIGENEWQFPKRQSYVMHSSKYQYCTYTIENGTMVYGEPQEFLIEVTEQK